MDGRKCCTTLKPWDKIICHAVDGQNTFKAPPNKPWLITIVCWYLQGSRHSMVAWVVQEFVHPQYVLEARNNLPQTRSGGRPSSVCGGHLRLHALWGFPCSDLRWISLSLSLLKRVLKVGQEQNPVCSTNTILRQHLCKDGNMFPV